MATKMSFNIPKRFQEALKTQFKSMGILMMNKQEFIEWSNNRKVRFGGDQSQSKTVSIGVLDQASRSKPSNPDKELRNQNSVVKAGIDDIKGKNLGVKEVEKSKQKVVENSVQKQQGKEKVLQTFKLKSKGKRKPRGRPKRKISSPCQDHSKIKKGPYSVQERNKITEKIGKLIFNLRKEQLIIMERDIISRKYIINNPKTRKNTILHNEMSIEDLNALYLYVKSCSDENQQYEWVIPEYGSRKKYVQKKRSFRKRDKEDESFSESQDSDQ